MANFFDRLFAAVSAFRGDAPVVAQPTPRPPAERARSTAKPSSNYFAPPNQDRYPRILGPNAAPADLSRALREATRGRMSQICDVASEMRETTSHLASQMGKRTGAISGADWHIDPAEVKGKAAMKRAARNADYARMRFGQIENFADRLEHLADGIYFGRSGLQINYQRDADGIGFASLHDISPKRLSYADSWRIHLYDERGNDLDSRLGTYPGVDIRKEWPDRFVIHEPKTLGSEIPTRQGLARVLIWTALFWKTNARFLMEFMELFANPWRVGEYDPQTITDEADIDGLRNELVNMSGLSVGVFPKGCAPKFLEVKDSRAHIDTHNIWCAEISKVINGGTLQSEVGSAGGNRAVAEVHERGEEKLNSRDGRSLDSTVRRDMIAPLIRLKFGSEDAARFCPIFRLRTARPEDVNSRAQRTFDFVDRGGRIDEDAAREELTGFKAPDEGAVLLKPLVKSTPSSDVGGDGAEAKDDAKAKDEEANGGASKPSAKKKPAADGDKVGAKTDETKDEAP